MAATKKEVKEIKYPALKVAELNLKFKKAKESKKENWYSDIIQYNWSKPRAGKTSAMTYVPINFIGDDGKARPLVYTFTNEWIYGKAIRDLSEEERGTGYKDPKAVFSVRKYARTPKKDEQGVLEKPDEQDNSQLYQFCEYLEEIQVREVKRAIAEGIIVDSIDETKPKALVVASTKLVHLTNTVYAAKSKKGSGKRPNPFAGVAFKIDYKNPGKFQCVFHQKKNVKVKKGQPQPTDRLTIDRSNINEYIKFGMLANGKGQLVCQKFSQFGTLIDLPIHQIVVWPNPKSGIDEDVSDIVGEGEGEEEEEEKKKEEKKEEEEEVFEDEPQEQPKAKIVPTEQEIKAGLIGTISGKKPKEKAKTPDVKSKEKPKLPDTQPKTVDVSNISIENLKI